MRIAVLWAKLTGYLNACLRAVASHPGVELFVASQASSADAPFSERDFLWLSNRYEFLDEPDVHRVTHDLNAFNPDVILACWHIHAFQSACLARRHRCVRVGCADNPWRATLKQRVASWTAGLHLRRYFDAMYVAGELQAQWARQMGFPESRIWKGSLSADVHRFLSAKRDRTTVPPTFLYAGRLSPEKGIEELARGYTRYHGIAPRPWDLIVAGEGKMRPLIEGIAGVHLAGFVQPDDLPAMFAEAACFVLPSRWDHWGVVLHEAAAAGLPIICTSMCGAAVHLLQDGYNGYMISPRNAIELSDALLRISGLSPQRREAMGQASSRLAEQFSPERWAESLLENASLLKAC